MNTTAYAKPVPQPTPETRPFWEGCKAHRLLLQCCDDCGHLQLYPRSLCANCHRDHLSWKESGGTGTVYSYSVVRRAPTKAFKADVPYVVAVIELAEGVRVMANVTGCPVENVVIGLPVKVVFDDVTDEISLPKFTPVGAGA